MHARPLKTSWLAAPITLTLLFVAEGRAAAQQIRADHTTLDIDNIPQSTLDLARGVRMSLDRASVGGYILEGMHALQASDATRYSFSDTTWNFRDRGNKDAAWKIGMFTDWVNAHHNDYDVLMMKFCYIDLDAVFDNYRDALNSLESAYPDKTFVWWTMPLRTVGDYQNPLRNAYNAQVRSYAAAYDKPLYDIADIESHDPDGNAVSVNNQEGMYAAYSTDGGHPDKGEDRLAKAMWWLMTRIALAREGVDAGPPPVDAGHDAGRDAGHDAGRDAGQDAGHDAGRDGGHTDGGHADGGHNADGGYTDGGGDVDSGRKRDGGGSSSGGSSSGGSSSGGSSSGGSSSGGSKADGGSDGDLPGDDAGGCAIGHGSSPLAFAPFAALVAGAVLRRRANRRARK